ncbi:OLC1v1016303C1 [Oldenlandia corymbosa var. corymbosa]|uniref:Aspartic proteinase Asp1 n=1 Tax=Oldenlandia corymbosa var. corymbosa TaxID=529605 RepID=A0AAV1E5E2_OLDCO|nr:OLC1v1016303C1 [Oldenlandia corymbosa var. corymbosa]
MRVSQSDYYGEGGGGDFTGKKGCYSVAQRPSPPNNKNLASSVIFPVTGNVYPDGYFHVTLSIGQPPKPYSVDIDTGSDITWLQCDAPCTKCIPAPHTPYKPRKNLVACEDPLCVSIQPSNYECESQDQCDYEIEYADSGSSMGVLVQDVFSLKFTNGSISAPRLAFGCGYHQEVPDSIHMPYTDGVLGLGTGKSSILYQLHNSGVIRNVVGHCLSVHGGGFLFFGDNLIPSSGIVWVPLSSSASEKYYSLGSADLLYGGQATALKGLSIIFDSGSTYSYLNSQAYLALVSLLKKDLNVKQLRDAADDKTLPICWKGPKPFKSISDVKSLFKPLQLVFKNAENISFQLNPEAYLIVTKEGNVCLGILNGSEVGLGDVNLIGDISLQDKLVIYDNEKQRIGWAPANCNRLPKADRDFNGGYYQPYEANIDTLFETCPAYDYKEKRKASKELRLL